MIILRSVSVTICSCCIILVIFVFYGYKAIYNVNLSLFFLSADLLLSMYIYEYFKK